MTRIRTRSFERHDGSTGTAVEMSVPGGLTVRLSSLGATLMGIDAPDRHGRAADVLLGWSDPRRYDTPAYRAANPYFGATAGRFANRIAGASFVIDGVRFALSANEGGTHLHGGADGFDRRAWTVEPIADGVRFRLVSPDGDQGYPGRLVATADYVFAAPDELAVIYSAEADRPTHVNLVSHGYFNLTGDPAAGIAGHVLSIAADRYVPIDAANLPLGTIAPVAGTPYDLRAPTRLGEALAAADGAAAPTRGFNHCYVLQAPGRVVPAARLHDPVSGRILDLSTDQPGLLFYSGDGLDGSLASDAGTPFGPRSGLCLEAQRFPDTPNQPAFPSSRLDPGGSYRSETRLRFTTDAD